ncbi:MAG: hypothetical protein QXV17_01570 [Candidatus Micrarchaeaceae archaeon]
MSERVFSVEFVSAFLVFFLVLFTGFMPNVVLFSIIALVSILAVFFAYAANWSVFEKAVAAINLALLILYAIVLNNIVITALFLGVFTFTAILFIVNLFNDQKI